ncbi:MAG: polysaccharide deacetylase family protein [Chitinispirillia bacterium]|jgi:peptidoglycan/xylan/chitin deacetylase (PgdA/CDA1 family)
MQLLKCEIIFRGKTDVNTIAFTFDDGPHPANTPLILDSIEEYGGRGTFFSTGENILKYRELSGELVKRGHLLANHTFSHPNALFINRKKLHDEIFRTKDIIENLSGTANRYFRPPYGIITPTLLSICRSLDLSIILWNRNSFDFKRIPYQKIVKRIAGKIKEGSIILFHECHYQEEALDYSQSIDALKKLINITSQKKLRPVTIQEMVAGY